MLSKRCIRATREETAIFIARATIGQACLGTPFSDDELREVVRHVEVTYGAFDERPEQFHAVAAAAALQAAKFANWYGSFGYDTEREIAGRSSLRYWLDHAFGEHNLGAHWVTKMAKLPPERFELDVAPEPKSSARCCSGPGSKHKFGVGESPAWRCRSGSPARWTAAPSPANGSSRAASTPRASPTLSSSMVCRSPMPCPPSTSVSTR